MGSRIAVIGPGADADEPSIAGRVYRDHHLPGAVRHPFAERPATHALTLAAGSPSAESAPAGPASASDVGIYRTSLNIDDYLAQSALAMAEAVYDDAGVVFMTRSLPFGLDDVGQPRGRLDDPLADRLSAATGEDADDWRTWIRAVQAAQQNAVIVQPAIDEPDWGDIDLVAGMPALVSELGEAWVTAVAVRPDGALVSAPCGIAADWCVAAPGLPVLGAMPVDWPMGTEIGESKYESLGGGMVAAARVVAALALMEEVLGLEPDAAARKILDTADRDFADFDEALHGRGMLDIAAALIPAPPVVVPIPQVPDDPDDPKVSVEPVEKQPKAEPVMPDEPASPSVLLADSRILPGTSFGDGFRIGLAPFRTVVLDRYGAFYDVDLSALVAASAVTPVDDLVMAGDDSPFRAIEIPAGGGGSLRFDARFADPGLRDLSLGWRGPAQTDSTQSWRLTEFGVGGFLNSDTPGRFTIFDSPLPDAVFDGATAADPFADHVDEASGVGMGLSFANGRSVEGWAYTGRGNRSRERTDGVTVRITDRRADGADIVQGGLLAEDGAMLGTRLSGAMGRGGRSLTGYISATTYRSYLDGHFDISAGASAGATLTSLAGRSLLLDLGPVRTGGLAGEIGFNDVVAANDRLSLSFEAPLRAMSAPGRLVTRVRTAGLSPTEGGVEDRIAFFDARPSGWEARWGLGYSTRLAPDVSLSFRTVYREHAGHDADAPADAAMRLRLSARL